MKRYLHTMIKQSPNDKRKYGHIQLANGLSALLISDHETKESSCSMNVKVGYFNDPRDLPGLAHFCEHMLFLGTETYPTEGEYKKYLAKYAGAANASTSSEYTNYYFSVNNEGFYGAMDRFSSFFTCPLFSPDGVSREVNAVDSEFRRNLQADSRRMLQLLKVFVNPQHPFSKFSTGNLHTLLHSPSNGHENQHEQLRKRVLQLYNETYSAHIMKLVCYGPDSVENMKEIVSEKFAHVKQLSLPHQDALINNGTTPDLFTEYGAMKMVHLVPVKDIRQLTLYWELPSQYPIFGNKVNFYLNYILEHQGNNSLYQHLRQQGLINGIKAGVYTESTTFSLYYVGIDLTLEGLTRIDVILQAVYQCLRMIEEETISGVHCEKGYQIFQEVKKLHDQSFNWLEKVSPSVYTSRISKRMQEYPLEDCLYAPYKFTDFDPELIRQHLLLLTPDRMHVQIVSKKFEEEGDHELLQEPIYGTKYFVKDMPQDLYHSLVNISSKNSSIHAPAPNTLISDDFSIKKEQKEFESLYESSLKTAPLPHPTIINRDDETSDKHRLWYKPVSHFSMPLAHIYSMIRISGDYIQNARGALLLKLYLSLVHESLADVSYDAEMADLSFEIHAETGEGIEVFFGGFSQKLHRLVEVVYDRLVLNPIFDQTVFDRIKHLYVCKYHNHRKDQANEQSKYLANMVTQEPFYAYHRYLKIVEKLELSDVIQFYNQTIRNNPEFHIDTFINGNLNEVQSKNIVATVDSILKHKSLPHEEQAVSYVYQLPRGKVTVLEAPSTNESDVNCSVNVHFQLGPRTLRHKIMVDLLAKIIRSYFFDSLRTKQQLGYSVHTRPIYYQCSLAFQFLIQSPSHHPRDIYVRVQNFLQHFSQILDSDIDEQSFENYKDALIKQKQKPNTKLLQESYILWSEIYYRRYHWDKVQDEVQLLSQVSKIELANFFRHYFLSQENKQELAVLVYGWPHIGSEVIQSSCNFSYQERNQVGNTFVDFSSSTQYNIIPEDDIEGFKQRTMNTRFPITRNSFANLDTL